jgi:hypothetical protein
VIACSSLDEVIDCCCCCSFSDGTVGWFSIDGVGMSESVLGLRRIVIGCEIGSGVDTVELSLLFVCFVFFLFFGTIGRSTFDESWDSVGDENLGWLGS